MPHDCRTDKSAHRRLKWTKDQDAARHRIPEFFANPDRQLLVMAGPAGTGKSTILADLFGSDDPTTAIVAPTAKACRVLHGMGLKQAQTCHALIYVPVDNPSGECRLCGKQFRDGDYAFVGEIRGETVRYVCDRCRSKLTNARSWRSEGPRFRRRDILDEKIRRIVVEESSMVGKRLAADILAFGLPILAVGDGFQLLPVKDEPGFDLSMPDIALTELHRAAWDNPITLIASVIREGGHLEHGTYGESKIVRSADMAELAAADQVIVGTNASRLSYNQRIRRALGFGSQLPEPGDRVVCCRNDHDKALINGAQFSVKKASISREVGACSDTVEMGLLSTDDPTASAVTAKTPADFFNRVDAKLPWYNRKELDEFTFANAITCHKAQGSEWPHVVVIDESACFRQDARRWLYTALSRASQRLTLVMP